MPCCRFLVFKRLALALVAGWPVSIAFAAPPSSFVIDGKPARATALDVVRTQSGEWPVADLGRVAAGRAYLFTYRQKPDWYSLCIVRPPDGGGTIDEHRYDVKAEGEQALTITVLPGSMKCADKGEPVTPTMARLAEAVRARRVLPYSMAAYEGFPQPNLRRLPATDVYRPDRIYGRSSSNNAIGIVSGQGGEADSSRGFLSGTDARMIAAALENDRKAFMAAAKRARLEVLYGLGLPNLVIWSDRHHQMRDPQIPFPGDRPYTNEGSLKAGDRYGDEGKWTAPAGYPYLDEIKAEGGKIYSHRRDEAHLFNHGYAYWLATGDPRAALLQQAIAAYALASNYLRSPGHYRPRFGYQRTTLNQFSALWKLSDVSANLSSVRGALFWPKARVRKINLDMWTGWKTALARLDTSKNPQNRSVSIFRGIDSNSDNAYSNFMIQAYGPEAAYLWASAGEPALLQRIAENFVLRFGEIGGARGYYGTGKGSGFPILVAGKMPYANRAGFVAWINRESPRPADSFDGSPLHYVVRGYWALALAEDAVRRGWLPPVKGLDAGIARTRQAIARTTDWKSRNTLQLKHGAVSFR